MPEILTESFCERCGTRYTFESAAPTKTQKLGRFKTISKGLKNYVMSDDTSLDEAMAAARSDDELEQTAQQLDAFHATFNFCMNCRQYTCGNCWNEPEGQCLTCAPHLGHEILPAPFPEMPAPMAEIGLEAWPQTDLKPEAVVAAAAAADVLAEIDAADRLDRLSATPGDDVPSWLAVAEAEALAAAEASAAVEAFSEASAPELPIEPEIVPFDSRAAPPLPFEPVAAEEPSIDIPVEAAFLAAATEHAIVAEPEPEPVVAQAEPIVAEVPVAPEPEAVAAAAPVSEDMAPADVDHQAAAAALKTSALLAKFRPGQSIDAELEAYEAALAAQAGREPERVAAEAEPELVAAAPEPDQVAAIAAAAALAASAPDPAPEPEPVAPAAKPEPVAADAEPDHLAAIAAAAALVAAAPERDIEPEPVAADADVAAAPEPEPIAAAAEAEPVAAEPAGEPVRTDVVEQPTWRIVAPDALPTNGHAPEEVPAAATATTPPPDAPTAPPQWPTAPQWPQPDITQLAQRRAASQSTALDALWAASVRDVVAPTQDSPAGTVQPCSSCGLSLSANARFCRRCGTRQGA